MHIVITSAVRQQRQYKNAYLERKRLNKISGKLAGMDQKQKKKIESATGLDRITREQIERWNQMTALGFQTGRRHQKSLASLRAKRTYRLNVWTRRREIRQKKRNRPIRSRLLRQAMVAEVYSFNIPDNIPRESTTRIGLFLCFFPGGSDIFVCSNHVFSPIKIMFPCILFPMRFFQCFGPYPPKTLKKTYSIWGNCIG